MKLSEILTDWQPETHPRPPETWPGLTRRMLDEEFGYLVGILWTLHTRGWFEDPVRLHGGYVQDAHHRIVAAAMLGWHDMDIPHEYIEK